MDAALLAKISGPGERRLPRHRGCGRRPCSRARGHSAMTTDPHLQAEADHSGRTGPLRVLAQGPRRRSAMRTLTVSGRNLRVAVRRGNPKWPPLLLCNGIGARLEMLQPFVDALDPRREVVRFDLPGIGGGSAAGA